MIFKSGVQLGLENRRVDGLLLRLGGKKRCHLGLIIFIVGVHECEAPGAAALLLREVTRKA